MSVFNVCTRAHTCKAQVWRWCTGRKEAFRVDEARDEASTTAAINRSTLGGPDTAHKRTGSWTAFLAQCGHVFRIAEFKKKEPSVGRNFGPTFDAHLLDARERLAD